DRLSDVDRRISGRPAHRFPHKPHHVAKRHAGRLPRGTLDDDRRPRALGMSTLNQRRHLLPEMEGFSARWYARQRGTPSQIAIVRREAAKLTAAMPSGAVLEVASGPGYLAVEIA